MIFGPVPLSEAGGAILAHSLGLPGRRLKKGRVLVAEDLEALAAAGIDRVTVARPGPQDLPEDLAAERVARALVPDAAAQRLWLSAPFTGRANIYADAPGLLRVDREAVLALNGLDEALTLATLDPLARVAGRQMVGTVKIIPYSAPAAAVERAEALLAGRRILSVAPVAVRSARLILTSTPGMKPSLVKKGGDAVRARLAALGIDAVEEAVVAHETGALAAALGEGAEDIVLILTGSATSDRADVGPAALVAAGGRLTRFGMPVDPGNLLFLGERAGRAIVGLPGCARSPKLNGADWVIERLACGIEVTGRDIAGMGVGGLLKEIPSRPEPRGGGARAPRRPNIAAVILAAGRSSRMRGLDKLVEPVGGRPLLAHVAAAVTASGVDQVLAVIRPGDNARAAALGPSGAGLVPNPRAAEGMASSIAAGIAALDPETDAVLIVMGDMPGISPGDIDRLVAGFDPAEGRAIVRAVAADGTPGHPVLFGRRFFEDLAALAGDRGARNVVAEHPEFVVDVTLAGGRALADLDTPEDWAAWREGEGATG